MSNHQSSIVTMTNSARSEVIRLLTESEIEELGIRLAIKGGGCSGLSYNLDFTKEEEGDTIIEFDGFKVFLDRKSTIYLSGIELDFEGGLQGQGFVFKNPMATNTCGCGQSFSI